MTHTEFKKMIESINQQEKELLNQFQNNNDMIEKIKESAKLQKISASSKLFMSNLWAVNNG